MANRTERRIEQWAKSKSNQDLQKQMPKKITNRFSLLAVMSVFLLPALAVAWKVGTPAQAESSLTETKSEPVQLASAPAPTSSDSEPEEWILAPNKIPFVPQFGEVPPLPMPRSAKDPNFHPAKVLDKYDFKDRVYIACRNYHNGQTEILVGKRGRDQVFSIASPVTGALPKFNIQDIRVGQKVASRDPKTGKNSFKRVSQTFKRTATELIEIELADVETGKVVDSIKGTPEHPFFVEGGGTVPLGKLEVGAKVVTHTGTAVVKSLKHEEHPEGVPVYNFEVEDDHTYFVGKSSAWVHNDCEYAPLKFLHSNPAVQNPSGYAFWRNKTTQEIIQSLKPGAGNNISLVTKSDGTILNGNTRCRILQERGVDPNFLPRKINPTDEELAQIFPVD